MARVTREAIVSIHDVLMGCRTLVRREVPVGETVEHYIPFAERVLDQYFYNLKVREQTLAEQISDAFELDISVAEEIGCFVEQELLPRIQRTFNIIYPNRHYTYKVNELQGFIHVVESEWPQQELVVVAEELDDTDAWIPPRLRK